MSRALKIWNAAVSSLSLLRKSGLRLRRQGSSSFQGYGGRRARKKVKLGAMPVLRQSVPSSDDDPRTYYSGPALTERLPRDFPLSCRDEGLRAEFLVGNNRTAAERGGGEKSLGIRR